MKSYLSAVILILLSLQPGRAVMEKGDWPWNLKLHGWHDRAVAEKLGTGWFLNVGPTGLRARITHEDPKFFTVKFVFENSPAHGLIAEEDLVVGANGKIFTVAHTFGRRNVSNWEGPMLEMSKHIEDSQGKDGKLELIVWPGGVKEQEKKVVLQLEATGRFSPTYPFDCPRSDKLMTDLCDFLVSEHKRAGKFENQVHTHASCVLALMASGDKKYQPLIRDIMSGYGKKRYDSTKGDGFPAWGQVHDGIVMGEYYLLTKDRSLLPAIDSLADCLNDSIWPQTGGLSHKPFAAIQRRMAEGGPKGYGAMAMPAGLGMVALSLFKEAGLNHAEPSYRRLHQAYLDSVGQNGSIDYGFKGWDHAVIELQDSKGLPKNSPKGIGYECLDGMKGIGEYSIVWPTKDDPRYRPTDWLKKEQATNRVFDRGGGSRLVIRTMLPEEPKKPMEHNGGKCDHFGRSGVGALAHAIGNRENESWVYLSDHMAKGCAMSGGDLMDGHASTHMHVLWGSLGAALAEEKDFRKYMEDIKWWMIMAQTHDGGFVIMPGRDYASTDHVYGTRNFPTACAALILSVKEKQLQITGAGTSGPTAGIPAKKKSLPSAVIEELNRSVNQSLAEFGRKGELKPLPMSLSIATTKVWLAKVETDGGLVFQVMEGSQQSTFPFAKLSPEDQALLARLVARLMPEDKEQQARAGIYMELQGDEKVAAEYYVKAGPELTKMSRALFE